MSDSWSSVWGHLVYFAKFQMLGFAKVYCSQIFHPVSTKLYCKYFVHEGIKAIDLSGDLPLFKKKNYTEIFVNTGP